MNLLVVADGMGDSNVKPLWYHSYYKWPDIVALTTKNCNVTNLSKFGAGNELITEMFRSVCGKFDSVIVQWTKAKRSDIVVGNQSWVKQIETDLIYSGNFVNINGQKFWASSESALVQNHLNFLDDQQYQNRLQLYIDYVKLYCNYNNKHFKFMLSYNAQINHYISDDWCWHDDCAGYSNFRSVSKFADLDFGYFQPIPLIAYDFVVTNILPKFNLPWRPAAEIKAVENMLYKKHKEAMENKPSDSD